MKSKSKINIQKYSLILILIAMMVVCSFLSSNFFTAKNLTNILKQVSIVTICAFAQGMIIICGEIDLSIGYLAGMAGSYACIVYVATENLVIAFLVGILLISCWSNQRIVCSIFQASVIYRNSGYADSLLWCDLPVYRRSEYLQNW